MRIKVLFTFLIFLGVLQPSYSLEVPSAPSEAFRDPFVSTAHGAIMATASRLRLVKFKYRNYVELPSPHFRSGKAHVLLYQETQKAPLLIALPGIASSNYTAMMNRALDIFSNRGFHTAVFHNSWSHSYLSDRPRHLPGELRKEAQVVLDLIPELLAKIGPEKVSEIHLYGESYGAFLSSVVKSLDKDRILSGKTLLAGPPINLLEAARNLDSLISRSQALRAAPATSFSVLRVAAGFFLSQIRGENPRAEPEELSQLISLSGFFKHLKQTVADLSLQPELSAPSTVNASNPRYGQYIEGLVEAAPANERIIYSLSHWLSELDSRGIDYQIVSAQDDFLNLGQSWSTVLSSPSRLSLLDWGGHLGFMGFEWWEKRIDQEFGPRRTGSEAPVYVGFKVERIPAESPTHAPHHSLF
jgi:hypothetical protein